MKPVTRFLALALALFLTSCHQAPGSRPVPSSDAAPSVADAEAVLGFLNAYGRRDLEAMMRQLDEDAVFRSSGGALSKTQIRTFFQTSFQKHPNLRVEVGPLKQIRATVRASVKVETNAIWTDTWIFEMKGHRIHAYSFASDQH